MDQRQADPFAPELDLLLVQAQRMDAIGGLAGGLAHELANSLAAIMAFGALLRRDPRVPADLRDDAVLLGREAERLRHQIEALLEFARRRPPERLPTRLEPLVRTVLDLQADTISARTVEVDIDVAADLPEVPIDRALMQQVFLNLTANAIEAMAAAGGGHLSIRADVRESAEARVEIGDDGPGIPAEVAELVFEPYFTTKAAGALGLGLPVSRAIVEAHGGRLLHEHGPGGRGAMFIVELPLGAAPAEAATGKTTTARPSATGAATPMPRARPRLLVVDDEPALRKFLVKALESIASEVVPAADGREAVELVRGSSFDAVLCDNRMPGMSGTDVYEAMVAIRPGLVDRFALMSGDVGNPAIIAFATANGIRLIGKPFDLAGIRETVGAMVGNPPAG